MAEPKSPYGAKDTDSDLEKAYQDIMASIDKVFTGTVNKEPKKDPKKGAE